MPDNELDPSGSTQEFRAFMAEPETARRSPGTGVIVGAAAVAAVIVIVVLVALMS